ncbi:MAG: PAS domain-containing protein [Candidatus Thorarchaeota archaeon]
MIGKNNVEVDREYDTKLYDDQLLHFADNSSMGVLIIQRGYLKYFNQKFTELFGYTKDDILKWQKREFYKIVHPEDLPNLVKNFKIEDDKKIVSVKFRGVTKTKEIINIENYNCRIEYNNKTAILSSYVKISPKEKEVSSPKLYTIKTRKKILIEYNPRIIEILKNQGIKFDIIKHCSYREEN